ncbi:MAG: response regulator [Legionella longbeachae]|nr:response regulator [Legionella longbeachae]
MKTDSTILNIPPPTSIDALSDIVNKTPRTSASSSIIVDNSSELSENFLHLLLVEDNKIALFTLENLIIQVGCRFTSVMDGEAALHLVQTRAFDLLITDLGLPGISGIELTHKIREFEKAKKKSPMPIIGLTAHSDEKMKFDCLQCGMNEVFTKPMTVNILSEIKKIYFPPESTVLTPNDLSD